MRARILGALQVKPMSSLELATYLKCETKEVYPATSVLKIKKQIYSQNDDQGDGTRRWFLAAGK